MIFNVAKWGTSGGGSGGVDPSGTTAVAGDVLTGKMFINSSGIYTQGTLPNRGNVNATIDGIATTSYTIPQGNHGGSGTVSLTSDIEDFLAAY